MRVEVCRTFYPHWGARSGIHQFLRFIDRNRFLVRERCVSDSDGDFPLKSERVRKVLRDVVRSHGMEWYKLSDLTVEMRILRRCLGERVDLVHYLDGEHSAQFLPLVLKRLGIRRPRFLATYHQPSELLGSLVREDVIRRLDRITVVSPEQLGYFRQVGVSSKVQVILHGIDTGHFSPGMRSRSGDVFKCVTVGHYLRDFNAVRAVAQKLSQRPEIQFQVVSGRAQGLEDLANVMVYKNVDDETLVRLYREADVLFLPLLQSTANNSLLEGIACGLPVVSTRLPSVKAYVPGPEAVLIPENDPDLLADALVELFENPGRRAAMGDAARARALELDWHRIGLQYEALYAELCG